jgi:Predicted RNA-binding protein, contains TRAM domain
MEISDDLECLFTAEIQDEDGTFQIQVPDREIELGEIASGDTYRVAMIPSETQTTSELPTDSEPAVEATNTESASNGRTQSTKQEPPVEVGETREVEIDSLGDQGDGIARVDRGYVLIIPDTEVGERVTVRIETTKQNVAFADVVDRHQSPQYN